MGIFIYSASETISSSFLISVQSLGLMYKSMPSNDMEVPIVSS
jgi:hypothetical protein